MSRFANDQEPKSGGDATQNPSSAVDDLGHGSAVKQFVGSVALGLVCFAIVAALMNARAGEGPVWAGWLCTTALAGFLVGFVWPGRPLRGVIFLILTQPPCVFVAVALTGEIDHPQRSTGGLVAVGIASMLLFLWSPIPMLFSKWGACVRRRGDAVE